MADYKLNMTGAQIDERLRITKMPNPNALTFTGGVSASYDGSEEKTIEIPKAISMLMVVGMQHGKMYHN